jgi:hypothetical protein
MMPHCCAAAFHTSFLQLVYSQPCIEESWSCEQPPDVLMGVVASDSRLGVRALRDWCEALQLPFLQPENRVRAATNLVRVVVDTG